MRMYYDFFLFSIIRFLSRLKRGYLLFWEFESYPYTTLVNLTFNKIKMYKLNTERAFSYRTNGTSINSFIVSFWFNSRTTVYDA